MAAYGSFRRLFRNFYIRLALLLLFAFAFLDILRVKWSLASVQSAMKSKLAFSKQEKVYIASIHWNNEWIIRTAWSNAVLDLVKAIGPANVYVSVYESGSWDDSKGALSELNDRLGELDVRRTFVLDATTHTDEITKEPAASGWIDTPRGKKELRRIPYLSDLRNRSLRPLEDLETSGEYFDKILFLNDVVFSVSILLSDNVLRL
ncbi:MAG: hypothetical protein Q9160_007726 [Pyrenula sp. 1 TL-2023]